MGARSSQSRGPGLNKSDGHLLEYFRQSFGAGGGGTNFVPIPDQGLTATGGNVGEYTEGSNTYKVHVFTGSGPFNVTELGDLGDTVEYLVVAGGGGGGCQHGGGGGAGGYRSSVIGENSGGGGSAEPTFTAVVADYPVIVGGGGAGHGPQGSFVGGTGTAGKIHQLMDQIFQ